VDITDPAANPLASGAFLSDEDFAQITKETSNEVSTKPTAALDKSGPRRKTAQSA
jgi:hypothetical protein